MLNNAARKMSLVPACLVLLVGAADQAAASVMYNTYNQYAANIGTDGDGDDGYTRSGSGTGEPVAWVGSADGKLPFGLSEQALPFANWAVYLDAAGQSETVSGQQAYGSYGVWADLDTTQGGWFDGSRGTIYSMDLGLIKSSVTQQVSINVANIDSNSWQNFGISVYSGDNQLHPETKFEQTGSVCCDINGDPVAIYGDVQYGYLSGMSHYGYWDFRDPAASGLGGVSSILGDDPFHSDAIDYVTHGEHSTVTFIAEADQIYVILLGGNSGGSMYGESKGYEVVIGTAPVPLPGAAWLFASALFAVSGFNRPRRGS